MIDEALQNVLQQQPLGLLFDIDGTLSSIAPTPAEARLYPGAAELLQRATQYAHVGIISGRGVADAARMVNLDDITYIGNHGLEWSDGLPPQHPIDLIPAAQDYVKPGQHLLELARTTFADEPGILVEPKSVGGTIHYRLAANQEESRQRILKLLEEPARQAKMKIVEGKCAIEIRTPLTINKGQALQRFCQQYQLAGIFFAGDDRTDLDAIQVIAQQKAQGLPGYSIAVQHPDTRTNLPQLLEQASGIVQEVEGMVQQLTAIVEYLAGHHREQ